jgi:DNA-binding beta-propeller fold protein YncE
MVKETFTSRRTQSVRSLKIGADGKPVVFAGRGTPENLFIVPSPNPAALFSGDGGPALQAGLSNPAGMVFDKSGTMNVADTGDQRIRKITPDGIINTVAVNGTQGFSGDGGPASAAVLNNPAGLAIDSTGNLYVADLSNHPIRQISPSGTISTYAGIGQFGS